ncbi:MAG: hypothetical protein MZV64_33635 [Ignavibacteriales bacterium]|nr:hypothetical protein [Ignavibacteriales bacterium]
MPYFACMNRTKMRDHGVEAEAFAHVGEEGDEQTLGMSFKHASPSSEGICRSAGGCSRRRGL